MLLATLFAARRSQDLALEIFARRRLELLGIAISFGDELANPNVGEAGRAKGE